MVVGGGGAVVVVGVVVVVGGAGVGDAHVKARIGCSSIAFGATPVCPCLKSKKATPVIHALAQTRTAARAFAVCRRRVGVAFRVQEDEGDSAIIVLLPSLSTRCRSPSSSERTSVTAAVTRKTCRSKGRRVTGSGLGAGRLTK